MNVNVPQVVFVDLTAMPVVRSDNLLVLALSFKELVTLSDCSLLLSVPKLLSSAYRSMVCIVDTMQLCMAWLASQR